MKKFICFLSLGLYMSVLIFITTALLLASDVSFWGVFVFFVSLGLFSGCWFNYIFNNLKVDLLSFKNHSFFYEGLLFGLILSAFLYLLFDNGNFLLGFVFGLCYLVGELVYYINWRRNLAR